MVDVDATARQLACQVVRQDLHITREDHQLGAGLLNQRPDLCLLFGLRRLGNGQMVERDIREVDVLEAVAWVIGNDRGDVHRQFAEPPAIQNIGQTVIEFRHQQHDPLAVRPIP